MPAAQTGTEGSGKTHGHMGREPHHTTSDSTRFRAGSLLTLHLVRREGDPPDTLRVLWQIHRPAEESHPCQEEQPGHPSLSQQAVRPQAVHTYTCKVTVQDIRMLATQITGEQGTRQASRLAITGNIKHY